MKIILNKCYGGFDVSDKGYELYAEKRGMSLYRYWHDNKCEEMHKGDLDLGFVSYYFTKDWGDSIKADKIDWTTQLYLDSRYRDNTILVKVVEELGNKASGNFGNLVVVDIPDNMDYVIDDYDGIETLHEKVKW